MSLTQAVFPSHFQLLWTSRPYVRTYLPISPKISPTDSPTAPVQPRHRLPHDNYRRPRLHPHRRRSPPALLRDVEAPRPRHWHKPLVHLHRPPRRRLLPLRTRYIHLALHSTPNRQRTNITQSRSTNSTSSAASSTSSSSSSNSASSPPTPSGWCARAMSAAPPLQRAGHSMTSWRRRRTRERRGSLPSGGSASRARAREGRMWRCKPGKMQ